MNETIRLMLTVALTSFALTGAMNDVRTRHVPNRLVLVGLALALLIRATAGTTALAYGFAGAAVALALGFPLFALGAFGGGDVKFMIACGAFVGLPLIGRAALYAAVAGGVVAVVVIAQRRLPLVAAVRTLDLFRSLITFGKRGERMSLRDEGVIAAPYAVAIAAGALIAWFGATESLVP